MLTCEINGRMNPFPIAVSVRWGKVFPLFQAGRVVLSQGISISDALKDFINVTDALNEKGILRHFHSWNGLEI